MSKFIIAHRDSMVLYPAKEEAIDAALHRDILPALKELVIYEIEECGSVSRHDMIAMQNELA